MRWLVLAASLLVLAAPAAHATCRDGRVDALTGVYDFTTVVLGAKKTSAIGVNGYYRMRVTAKGCELQAEIAKLGFTNVMFPRERIQYGKFAARTYDVPDDTSDGPTLALFVDATLAADKGSTLSVGFTFVEGNGFWRYVGDSWQEAGMWGALSVVRVGRIDAPFAASKRLRCSSERIGAGTALGVAFDCGDLIVARPTLDLALFRLGRDGVFPYGFRKIAASGADGGGWVDYCYWARGDGGGEELGAGRFRLAGGNTALSGAAAASVRKCGGRAAAPAAPRWEGGVR